MNESFSYANYIPEVVDEAIYQQCKRELVSSLEHIATGKRELSYDPAFGQWRIATFKYHMWYEASVVAKRLGAPPLKVPRPPHPGSLLQ